LVIIVLLSPLQKQAFAIQHECGLHGFASANLNNWTRCMVFTHAILHVEHIRIYKLSRQYRKQRVGSLLLKITAKQLIIGHARQQLACSPQSDAFTCAGISNGFHGWAVHICCPRHKNFHFMDSNRL
jgi:hypothetical protein